MTFPIYTVSLKIIQSIRYSKWRLSFFSDGNHPPYPPSFFCFHQNDRKGCRGFKQQGKNLKGVVTNPLGMMGLRTEYVTVPYFQCFIALVLKGLGEGISAFSKVKKL